MKTVGIIGGLGPDTTAVFYLELIKGCSHAKQRPQILIWNVPMPHKVEMNLIIHNRGERDCLQFLIEGAKRLEKGGADFLVMPCNTLHMFIEEIRASVNIPVLSIVEETVNTLLENGISKVGFLSTSATISKGIYKKGVSKTDIQICKPSTTDQKQINKIIYNIVLDKTKAQDKKKMQSVIKTMKKEGISTVVLACTDLQHIVPKTKGMKVYDTMQVLADATIRQLQS